MWIPSLESEAWLTLDNMSMRVCVICESGRENRRSERVMETSEILLGPMSELGSPLYESTQYE